MRLWFSRKGTTVVSPPVPDLSSTAQLKWVGGRLVMQSDPYVLPKDLQESNRLDLQHYMLKYALLGNNYLAPIQMPQAVLDIGCGTGRWVVEMAQQFPQANIIGVDLVVPSISDPPFNCTFTAGNILTGLDFPDQSFDFVHMRLLYSAIPARAWPGVIHEMVRMTRQGGWIESVEAATIENRGPSAEQMNTWIIDACRMRGLDMTIAPHLGLMLQTAGLQDVQQRIISLPIGENSGRLGAMLKTDIVAIMQGAKPLVVSQGLTSSEDYDTTIVTWQREAQERHMTFPFYYYFGRRK